MCARVCVCVSPWSFKTLSSGLVGSCVRGGEKILRRPKTMFAPFTQSQAIPQSIAFSSELAQLEIWTSFTLFHFFETLLYIITASLTMLKKIERFCWADYEQNTAQNTYWKNGANQSVKSNPRLRIEAGWYVADRIRIRIEPPHAFDCRERAKRNRIRNLKNLAVRNSKNTCRLSGSSIRNHIRNLQSAEPL